MLRMISTRCYALSLALILSPVMLSAQPMGKQTPFYRNYQFLEYAGQQTPVIGQILKDQKLGRISEDDAHVQLILARLYVDLGLHIKAVDILSALSQTKLDAKDYQEVWFQLGKSYYHTGHFKQAEQALEKLKTSTNSDMRNEAMHLLGLISMSRENYADAAQDIQDAWQSSAGIWGQYARFNLAVAQIRSGHLDQGLDLLKQASLKQVAGNEAQALIDKINQTIGYLYLQKNEAEQARLHLERVRLNGPYSNMALLGAGWAGTMLQQYKQALVPWLELHGRDIREVPVQEVMLSVPYAYEQLGAWGQAADYYQRAIDAYQQEQGLLSSSIASIQNNEMGPVLAQMNVQSERNWLKNIRALDDKLATRYIRQLMDDDLFFNTMNNYREARFIALEANTRRESIAEMTGDMYENLKRQQQDAEGDDREQLQFIGILAADLFKRADLLVLHADQAIDRQLEKLKRRALHLLERRKERLDVYLVQARLALAQSLNRLENQ